MILHGSDHCDFACGDCDGSHHWQLCKPDPLGNRDVIDQTTQAIELYDEANGTNHSAMNLRCSHCQAWAEIDENDSVDEFEEFEPMIEDDFPDTDYWEPDFETPGINRQAADS